MKRSTLILLAAFVWIGLSAGEAQAQCCGAKAKTCAMKPQAKGCPVEAALVSLKLTGEQQKKIAEAKATFKASIAKARECGCPKKGRALKRQACAAYKQAIAAARTLEKKKAFRAVLVSCRRGVKTCPMAK